MSISLLSQSVIDHLGSSLDIGLVSFTIMAL